MKIGRPKTKVEYPANYPLLLFDVIDPTTKELTRVVAKNKRTAKKIHKIKYALTLPTVPSVVVKELGHQGASKFYQKFGDSWVIKDGKIFYGKIN